MSRSQKMHDPHFETNRANDLLSTGKPLLLVHWHCRALLAWSAIAAITLPLRVVGQDALTPFSSPGTPAYSAASGTAPAATYSAPTDANVQPITAPTPSTYNSELHNDTVSTGSEVSSEPRRFQYRLQITVRGVYDDNINITQSRRVSDYYVAIEPVLTLGFGNITHRITGPEESYLRFDYAPGLYLFANHSEDDALQHVISLQGQHQFARLTLSVGEEIAILDGTDLRNLTNQTSPGSNANIDIGQRARFQTYDTKVNASYDLTGKTFLSTGFESRIINYNSPDFFSSETVSGNLFINYRYRDKLAIGLGGTGGYDAVDGTNPNQTFEQANLRVGYYATEKISLNISGGVEFRQFENNSRGEYVSPVYEVNVSYQPTDATTMTVSGSRRIYNSGVLGGQDYTGTIIAAGLRQRLAQRFFVGFVGGYENDSYFSTVSGFTTNRNDDYFFIEPSIDFAITRFWLIGGYYLHRQDDSSLQPFSFKDNQTGFRTTLVF